MSTPRDNGRSPSQSHNREVTKSTDAIATNDSSIVSKRSAERAGYFARSPYYQQCNGTEQFLKCFVKKPARRSPLINLGYFIRCLCIELIIQEFLTQCRHAKRDAYICNLGCGFDPTFFRLASQDPREDPTSLRYIDVDYPASIQRKRELIKASPDLMDILPSFGRSVDGEFVPSKHEGSFYATVGCDLRDVETLRQKFDTLLQDKDVPILFLSEVALVYMNPLDSFKVLQFAASYRNGSLCILEQTLPDHPSPTAFSSTMLRHFSKNVKTPLRGVDEWPTLQREIERFGAAGWTDCQLATLHKVWNSEGLADAREHALKVEPFDEFEELDLFLSHYYIAVAANPSPSGRWVRCDHLGLERELQSSITSSTPSTESPSLAIQSRSAQSMTRRAHTCTALGDGRFVVFGGFGLPQRKEGSKTHGSQAHSRLAHTTLIKRRSGNLSIEELPVKNEPSPRLYHSADMINGKVYVFGGRTSPTCPLGDLHVFDPDTSTWSEVKWDSSATDGPQARYRHASTVLPAETASGETRHCLFVHGGIGADAKVLSDAWLFDPESRTWRRCSTVLQGALTSAHSHVVLAVPTPEFPRRLVRLGGISSLPIEPPPDGREGVVGRRNLATIILDPLSHDQVVEAREIGVGNSSVSSLSRRYGMQAVAWGANKVLVSGGVSADGSISPREQLAYLNLDDLTCDLAHLPGPPRLLVDHTISLSTTSDGNPSVLVAGGGATCFSFGSHFDDEVVEFAEGSSLSPGDDVVKLALLGANESDGHDDRGADPLDGSWAHPQAVPRISIGRVDKPAWHQILAAQEPTVLASAQVGDCITKWTPEYLIEKCGHRKVSVHICPSKELHWHDKNFIYKTMPFEDLIRGIFLIDQPTDTLYLRSLSSNPRKPARLDVDFSEISQDFAMPEPLAQTIEEHFFSSPLRVSSPDMGLWPHYDVADNVLVQVKGKKRVRLWHPAEVDKLYIEGSSSRISSVDRPDLVKFPLFRDSHPIETVLEPGDVLFIPSCWIHSVQALEPSISVNIFFRRQPPDFFQHGDVWGNADVQPYTRLRGEVLEKAVHDLAGLEDNQRRFYLKKLANDLIGLAEAR